MIMIDFLFCMTQLINRNSTKDHHAKMQPIVSGN